MKRISLAVILAGGLASSSFGLEYNAIAVQQAGFDYDAVVENTATAGSNPTVYTTVAQPLDASNNVFYEAGLSGSSGGLPDNNQITATTGGNSFTFDLVSYGTGSGFSNNALQIAPSEINQTLTFVTPGSFQSLAFLGFSTEAQGSNAIGNVVITFSDLTTTSFIGALDYPDWYTGSGTLSHPQVFNSQGRVQTTTGLFNQNLVFPLTSASGGQLFASVVTLSQGDQAKLVQSVTFSISSSTPADRSYVMGVAGAVPEPGTVGLMALAAGVLAFLRPRRRS